MWSLHRSHLWRRRRLRRCGLNHLWSICSCTSLCHWPAGVWLSVCCSESESDVWTHRAPPSPPLMRPGDGGYWGSSSAGCDLWQEMESKWWGYTNITESLYCWRGNKAPKPQRESQLVMNWQRLPLPEGLLDLMYALSLFWVNLES